MSSRYLAAITACALMAGSAGAAEHPAVTPPPVTQAQAEAIVASFEDDYAKAYGHPDVMLRLMTKDVVIYTNRGVLRQGRAEEEANERKAVPGASRVERAEVTAVQVLGGGRVILEQGRGRRLQLGKAEDYEGVHPPSETYFYTKALVFEDGGWKLAFAQFATPPKP